MTCDEIRELAPLFVLGALEADEVAAIREHVDGCADAHAELVELGSVVPALAAAAEPIEPPAELRGRLMAAAAAEAAGVGEAAGERSAALEPIAFRPPPARRPAPISTWVLRAAAAFAIVALGAWNVLLQGEVGRLQGDRDGLTAVLTAAAEPGSQLAVLAGDDARVRGAAAVRADGTVVLALQGLAATSGDQVYETWLIVGGGAPVPVGGFTVGADGLATFASRAGPTAPGAIVAVTLEPGPGATAPTLPIVASGIATPPPTG
jgi:anti-sigma-K factor RskA